jgi:hypothetical protein
VYCLLLLINTSVIAMNYGFRVSTKSWPYQSASIEDSKANVDVRLTPELSRTAAGE